MTGAGLDYSTREDSSFARGLLRVCCHVDGETQSKVKRKPDIKMELKRFKPGHSNTNEP